MASPSLTTVDSYTLPSLTGAGHLKANEPPKVQEDKRLEDAHAHGGLLCRDQNLLHVQRSVVWEFCKHLGTNLLDGKDLVRTTLPIEMFEPQSFLQRLALEWSHAPCFLTAAAACKDPVERLKHVVSFAVAGLHVSCGQRKPFNPILGETFQATFADGTILMVEQVLHHPPVSSWQIFGPDESYYYYGKAEFSGAFRGNSMKCRRHGTNHIVFKDGTRVSWVQPWCYIRGVLWGERVSEFVQLMDFHDETHDLTVELHFNPDDHGFIRNLFSRAIRRPSDYCVGEMYRAKPGTPKDQREVLAKISGTWLGWLDIGEERVWDVTRDLPEVPLPVMNPLPSDSRYREDLRYLAEGDMDLAREYKHVLEEKQRYDRRLRKDYKKEAKKQRKHRGGSRSSPRP